jgi:hypothetical protein
MEKLRFDVRMAEAEAAQRHYDRRLFWESYSPTDDIEDHLVAFIEESVVEAEMKRTRTHMTRDQHTHDCLFCSPGNSN